MSKYLIHACQKRKWYVDEYLLPSLLKQGIDRGNIIVYNDATKAGCLPSFIESAKLVLDEPKGTWHLQDDIIISSNFKTITERFDKGIVCGFCSYYSEDVPFGLRPVQDMWYSFPCIRIPNSVLKEFIGWLTSDEIQNKYRAYIQEKKFVDTLFMTYIKEVQSCRLIHNLYPNIVDNVDYLLGGSTINYQRDKEPVSLYFQEHELVEELKYSIQNSVYRQN